MKIFQRNHIKKITIILLVLFALIFSTSWHVGGKLVASTNHPVSPPIDLNISKFSIESESGAHIAGWHIPLDDPKGIVMLLHGIRSSRSAMIERARLFNRNGFAVMMIDFQAHGESLGETITIGHLEKHDVVALVNYTRKLYASLPIVTLGVSMGGAAALLASPLNVDALILESVYPDIRTAVKNRVRKRVGPLYWIPSELLLAQLGPRLGIELHELRPIDYIEKVNCPVFIISGLEDQHTTIEDTNTIFENAAQPKELWLIENAGHIDLYNAAKEEYESKIINFLNEHIEVLNQDTS